MPVESSNQRVLTTAQVAEGLKCSVDLLKHLFKNHKGEFQDGVHFLLLKEEPLRLFKSRVNNLHSANQGVARLSKLIDTPEAWQLFTELEQFYFKGKTVEPPPVQDSLFPDVEPIKPKKRRPAPKLAVVYVVEFDNGWSKLGFTGNLTERIDKLMELTKLDYSRWFATAPMSLEDARQLESSLKARFADYHLQGEFYSAPFDDIKNALNFAHASPADKLIALADKVKDDETRDKLYRLPHKREEAPLNEELQP